VVVAREDAALRVHAAPVGAPPRRLRDRLVQASAAGPVPRPEEVGVVGGEMHEIGDGVPHRERFAIPRGSLPNRRRKQMREQFMRRTRLVLKDSVRRCRASRSSSPAAAPPRLSLRPYALNPRTSRRQLSAY
jgi:hypothetical protein